MQQKNSFLEKLGDNELLNLLPNLGICYQFTPFNTQYFPKAFAVIGIYTAVYTSSAVVPKLQGMPPKVGTEEDSGVCGRAWASPHAG